MYWKSIMKIREIAESAGTVSGAIATVSHPMGLQTRNGGSLLAGKYSTDPTPNTPKEYKRNKNARGQFKNSIGK
jgi:hypothetical protein